MLNEKREMTNKENNPPSNPAIIAPEKPLRRDLLRERVLERMHNDSLNGSNLFGNTIDSSSYVFQNTFSNDEEYATINRLMADCNIEYETTSENRSPLKMLAITRPSTIAEESSSRSDFDDHSIINILKATTHSVKSSSESSSNKSCVTVEHYAEVLCEIKAEGQTSSNDINIDDTLEEIEYVQTDQGLNYVPKRSKTESETAEEIIVIDSSPECSFTTTKNAGYFKSTDSTEYSFHTARADFTTKSISEKNDINDINTKFLSQNDSESGVEQTESDTGTICQSLLSHSRYDNVLNNMPVVGEPTPRKEISEYSARSSANIGEMPDFNNTLERVEYMMAQGEKMLNKKTEKKLIQNSPIVTGANRIRTPGSTQKKCTPAKRIIVKPSPIKTDVFKRPDQRIRSPAPSTIMSNKLADTHQHVGSNSKIPKSKLAIASSSKLQFSHVASPVAAYINNTPEVPLIKTIKPIKDFFDSTYYNKMSKEHDISTQSVESLPIKSSLPRKFYNSAPQRQVKLFNN